MCSNEFDFVERMQGKLLKIQCNDKAEGRRNPNLQNVRKPLRLSCISIELWPKFLFQMLLATQVYDKCVTMSIWTTV